VRCRAIAVAGVLLAACAGVLGLRGDAPTPFPHRAHVLHGIACTTCHAGIAQGGDDGALHLPGDATCTAAGCHATPHDARPCLGCHADAIAIAAAGEARDHLRFAHDRHLPRVNGNCMRCHVGVAGGDARLRPEMQTCFGCHAHEAARDARTCDACHRNLDGDGTLPASHLSHDGDWLHEHGVRAASSADVCASCHQTSFCAECHGVNVAALPARLHFDDPFRASVHRAGFASRHAIEARAEPGACSTCHTPTACQACHERQHVAPAKGVLGPHPPGWIGLTRASDLHGRAARADPASCAGCHGGGGERLCVKCHQVGGVGGNPHPAGWQSRQPLGALPCRLCHTNGRAP
jgi:Cytochrome c7 and related cytochrome c